MRWRCNGALLAVIWGEEQGQGEDLPGRSRAVEILQPAGRKKCAWESPWELYFGSAVSVNIVKLPVSNC